MTYTEKAAPTQSEDSSPDDCHCGHERLAHRFSDGICRVCGCGGYRAVASLPEAPEAPLTPEEEEEAPEDPYASEVDCGSHYIAAEDHSKHDCTLLSCEKRAALPVPECGHPNKHATGARFSSADGETFFSCPDCPEKWAQPTSKAALPVRRPPYAVAYRVGDRLFEVLLPGDCQVRAEGGALVIRHPEPVSGITDVAPVRNAP